MKAGQGRAGQGRAGQGRAGQGRAGQGRAGQGSAGQRRLHLQAHCCQAQQTLQVVHAEFDAPSIYHIPNYKKQYFHKRWT